MPGQLASQRPNEGYVAELNHRPARTADTLLFEVALALFVAGFLLQNLYAWLPPVNRLVGAFLGILAIAHWRRRSGGILAEVVLFGAFVAWAAVTGLWFAGSQSLVFELARLTAQELVLMFALAEYVSARGEPTFPFRVLLAAPLCLWWYSYSTGQLGLAARGVDENVRLLSLTSNPNYLGFLCLYGFYAVAYFLWNRTKSRLVLWPLLALPFIGAALVLSGSRKSILAAGVFALAWASLAYGRTRTSRLRPALMLLTTLVTLFVAGRFILENAPVGERFRRTAATPNLDVTRYTIYRDGWRMFMESPVFGVGLGNFVTYSSVGASAHSDFLEVLAETGVAGFVLYLFIYLVIWRRLVRVLRKHEDATARYMAGLYQAMIVTALVLGLGAPCFLDPMHLYIVGMMVGHTHAMEQELSSTGLAESGTDWPASTTL